VTWTEIAAAYAESGDFEHAKEWEEKAIGMAPDENSKQDCRSRLELYKQGKPFHEEPRSQAPDAIPCRASASFPVFQPVNADFPGAVTENQFC